MRTDTQIDIIKEAKRDILKNEEAFTAVLPKGFDSKEFMATLCLDLQKNPKLALCTNLIQVARDVASFGLLVGGLAQQAHLIPFYEKATNSHKAQLIIGYRGYITKLDEAGYNVEAEIVTNDELNAGCFTETRGSETTITHNPIRSGIRDRSSIALAYCVIKKKNCGSIISVLSKEEIEEIAKTSKYEKNGAKVMKLGRIWTDNTRATDFGQLCIKTVIRNCIKRVNLRVLNEMSTYEGRQEEKLVEDSRNTSKTALLPSDIDLNFEERPVDTIDNPSQENKKQND